MNYSPRVGHRHSGSTLIDALLVRALAGRKALLRPIAEWQRRAANRRELMRLTDRDLRDIGFSRCEPEAEAKKPFCETYWQLMNVTDLEDNGTARSKPFWMTYWL